MLIRMESTEQLARNTAQAQVDDRPRLTVGDRIEVTPESWGRLGEAMARHNGEPVFVLGGIPGERVTAQI